MLLEPALDHLDPVHDAKLNRLSLACRPHKVLDKCAPHNFVGCDHIAITNAVLDRDGDVLDTVVEQSQSSSPTLDAGRRMCVASVVYHLWIQEFMQDVDIAVLLHVCDEPAHQGDIAGSITGHSELSRPESRGFDIAATAYMVGNLESQYMFRAARVPMLTNLIDITGRRA